MGIIRLRWHILPSNTIHVAKNRMCIILKQNPIIPSSEITELCMEFSSNIPICGGLHREMDYSKSGLLQMCCQPSVCVVINPVSFIFRIDQHRHYCELQPVSWAPNWYPGHYWFSTCLVRASCTLSAKNRMTEFFHVLLPFGKPTH